MKQTNDKFDTPLQSNADVDTLDYKFNPVIRENMASYHSFFLFFSEDFSGKNFCLHAHPWKGKELFWPNKKRIN